MCGYILAEQRPGVREAPAVSRDRGALFRLFCFQRPTPYTREVPMSATVFLSRPGRCAGRVPLSLLVHKLTRYGEEAAAQALQELPLPFQRRRVWWLLAGNKLVLEVA